MACGVNSPRDHGAGAEKTRVRRLHWQSEPQLSEQSSYCQVAMLMIYDRPSSLGLFIQKYTDNASVLMYY